jgi:hypothetical protein
MQRSFIQAPQRQRGGSPFSQQMNTRTPLSALV